MTETAAIYTATPVPAGAEDLMARIRAIIDERDTYKAKYERQGKIIARLANLLDELQLFLDEAPQGLPGQAPQGNAETPAATIAPRPNPTPAPRAKRRYPRRRYGDDEVRGWIAQLRAGKGVWELHKELGIGFDTIQGACRRLGAVIEKGRLVSFVEEQPTPKPPSAPEPSPKPPSASEPAITDYYHEDDTVGEWVKALEAGKSADQIGAHHGVSAYTVLARVRLWREEHGETPREA